MMCLVLEERGDDDYISFQDCGGVLSLSDGVSFR